MVVSFLWLKFVEHFNFAIKTRNNFINLRMATLYNNGYKLYTTLVTPNFCSLYVVVLSLLITIKPSKKKPCSLRLLVVSSTTHIKQYLGVLIEKLFYNADKRLRDFLIIR